MTLEKKWEEKFKEVPADFLNGLTEYPNFLKEIFWSRSLKSEKEIENFLNPNWKSGLHSPKLLLNIGKAVERIKEAIKKNEKIIIFGDYDADGVTGSAILNNFLKRIEYSNFDVFLPSRKEGYGLSGEAVKRFSQEGAKLIITNDCGITNVEETKLANELKIDTIITDHHLPQDNLPPAVAIIDPHLPGDKYPFKSLSGAGVAFKLVQAMLETEDFPFRESFEKWSSDLLAISAIADWVPLLDENRVFTKFGLVALSKTKETGLLALKKVAGLEGKSISSRDVAFIVAPFLNSASRMDHANTAFELLVTESEAEADWIAKKLEGVNRQRQEEVREAYQQAIERIKEPLPKIIALGSPAWRIGVVSNLASRLREEFFRPVFLWQEKLLEIKGSSRSIEGFNLVEALDKIAKKNEDLFISFGGHAMAAGFSVKPQYLETFLQELHKIADKQIKDEDLIPRLRIDAKLVPEDLEKDFFGQYQQLEPFGVGNEEPNFLIERAKVKNVSSVGNNGKHLKLKVEWAGKFLDAISFGQGDDWQKIAPDDYLDLVFNVRKSTWQGNERLDLYILDWKKSKI